MSASGIRVGRSVNPVVFRAMSVMFYSSIKSLFLQEKDNTFEKGSQDESDRNVKHWR